MGATRAKIQIGETVAETAVDPKKDFVVFTLDLKAGDYDLQTWLDRDGEESGALFVYVSSE